MVDAQLWWRRNFCDFFWKHNFDRNATFGGGVTFGGSAIFSENITLIVDLLLKLMRFGGGALLMST